MTWLDLTFSSFRFSQSVHQSNQLINFYSTAVIKPGQWLMSHVYYLVGILDIDILAFWNCIALCISWGDKIPLNQLTFPVINAHVQLCTHITITVNNKILCSLFAPGLSLYKLHHQEFSTSRIVTAVYKIKKVIAGQGAAPVNVFPLILFSTASATAKAWHDQGCYCVDYFYFDMYQP